ncbi:MAG: RNA polymerase factor sigma-54 [Simkaniaceae bacterium]|nr:MAG: RNA polymerase factor sigma-54 [Simkaniaceae bacterium]
MEIHQSIRQDQRLIMNVAMERAFHVLMMPTLELNDWLEREIEKNPLLKLIKNSSEPFDQSLIRSEMTLYDYLMHEIELHFQTQQEKEIAREIAGSLDEKGFLTLTSEELKGKEAVLKKFHQIEPLGLGARNVREALLIQLKDKMEQPIYRMVSLHYDDLLYNRLGKISKSLKISLSALKEMIQKDLRPLNPFPGRHFERDINPHLSADVSIIKEGDLWSVEVNDSDLPTFEIHETYLDTLENPSSKRDEVDFIRRHLAAGNWLLRIIQRRQKTLHEIATYLLKRQRDYLEGIRANPCPMTMKEVAEALTLSESTITRAIAHKAIATPRGLIKFRNFFTHAIQSQRGEISNQEAKDLLLKLIHHEKEPLSDEALSQKLKSQGIQCARRTVAKYRKELMIGSASQRKMWKL